MKPLSQRRFRLWHLFVLVTIAAAGVAWASNRYHNRALLSRPYILVEVEPVGSAVYRDGQYLGLAPLIITMPDAFFDCYEEKLPPGDAGPLLRLTKKRTDIVLYDGGQGTTLSFIRPDQLGEKIPQERGMRTPIASGGFVGPNFSGTSPNRLLVKLDLPEPTATHN